MSGETSSETSSTLSSTFSKTASSKMSRKNYGRLAIGIIAVWFTFALIASAYQLFRPAVNVPPIALGLAAAIPIVVFLVWYYSAASFREFALSLDARVLTILQSWRIAGFVFVVLYVYGVLPGLFANPAGWGDIAIGLTAPWVAMKLAKPGHKAGFVIWNALGMFDLVEALALGTAARVIHPGGIGADLMTVLPLSVVPTFLVPMFFIFHIIAIEQARRWPVGEVAVSRNAALGVRASA
jgi:hypothetical protein